MNLSRTRMLAAGLVLAAAIALAGCSAAEKVTSTASAAEAVRQAGEQAAAQSHAFEMTIAMEVAGLGDIEMFMEGEFDPSTERGHVTMDFLGRDTEMITDGKTVYSKLDGDEWVKMEVDVPQPAGIGNGYDPSQQLAYLQMVSDDVKEVGTEKIRGRETTKYRGSVSMENILEQFSEEEREMVEELSRFFKSEGFDMTVWVDKEGRPAKIEYAIDMEIEGSGVVATYVMEFFDWGRDVNIELPPADKVVDAADYSSFFN